jgi:hypothetical protein
MSLQVGVIGSGECDKPLYDLAYEVGKYLAREKAILINGGLGGVMEASAKGAKEHGGVTVGILPYKDRWKANPYMDVVIATGMGHARNVIIVQSSDVLISVGGEFGTLSEIAIALKEGKKVISLSPPYSIRGLITVESPEAAVKFAVKYGRIK